MGKDFEDSSRTSNGLEEPEVYEVEVVDEDAAAPPSIEEPEAEGDAEVGELPADDAELDALRDEVAHLREMYLRKLAEFDNFRKRIERERKELKRTAAEEVVLDLIPVLDNFERALEQQIDTDSDAFRQGVDMISRQLSSVLEKRGLEQFDPMGEPFQPELHEAVQQVENDELPPGSVAWVLAKGYLYGEKLVRPAMVGVTRGEADSGGGSDVTDDAKEESAP